MPEAATATAPKGSGGYGALELKKVYQRYWAIGFGIAVAIHFVLIGSYYLAELLRTEEPPSVTVRIMKYSDLGPPPSITSTNTPPPISVSAPAAKPTVGAPVPVPDAEVTTEATIATQQEMSNQVAPVNEALGNEGNVQVEQNLRVEDDAPPADFVPVEKEPVVVKKVEPKYPDLAMRAGLEGKVWVKIWVDKEGKAKQVIILKSDAEIFNEPAMEAAKQFVFTPAYMNDGPVPVWVTITLRFALSGGK